MRDIDNWMITVLKSIVYRSNDPTKFATLKLKKHKKSNTEIVWRRMDNNEVIVEVYLFNNKIAEFNKTKRSFWLSHCGWLTRTTKSRLWALLEAFTSKYENRSLCVYKGKWYEEPPLKPVVGKKRRRFDALTPSWSDENGRAKRMHFIQPCEYCGESDTANHLCPFYSQLPHVDDLIAYKIRSYIR